MGDNYWRGTAPAVAQTATVQITGYHADTTYTLTVGNVAISTSGGGSVNAVATQLAAAWEASTHPFAVAVAAVANTDTVTLTANTPGVPFTITSSKSGTGTIGSVTASVANAGPNDWSTAANWSLGTVPVNSDRIFIANTDVSILWGLGQTGVTPALLQIDHSFTGQIGLPYLEFTTAAGSTEPAAYEYRTTYLGIATAILRIGENHFASRSRGSSLIKINTHTANCATQIFNSGVSDDDLPPIRLKGTHASATAKIYGGSVGFCIEDPAETGQLATVEVFGGGTGGTKCYIGEGVTLATFNQVAGESVLFNLPTNIINESTGTLTLANPEGGTIADTQNRGRIIYAGGDIEHTAIRG